MLTHNQGKDEIILSVDQYLVLHCLSFFKSLQEMNKLSESWKYCHTRHALTIGGRGVHAQNLENPHFCRCPLRVHPSPFPFIAMIK